MKAAVVVLALASCRGRAPDALDRVIEAAMAEEHVPGLAFARIELGRVVDVRAYGLRSVEAHQPLTTSTVMYAASLTKATFAVFVMQLVQEGRIDLDRSIADYLPEPLPEYPKYADLRGDERWRKLTFRMLLDHTTGFANFRALEDDGLLRFHRDPGARFGYSGEGINLAQFVLETGLGLDVGAEMQRRIFLPLGMTRTSLHWEPAFEGNVADGYTEAGALLPHQKREHVRAAGSMDTTIADWSRFLAAVARRSLLSPRAHAEMLHEQIGIDSAHQFPTFAPETTQAYAGIRLGYGLGWGRFDSRWGAAFFKEGHDDGTANFAICLEPSEQCIVIMSNSVRAERIFQRIIESQWGPIEFPYDWAGYAHRP